MKAFKEEWQRNDDNIRSCYNSGSPKQFHLEKSCSYTDGALRQDNNISINGARIPKVLNEQFYKDDDKIRRKITSVLVEAVRG